MHMLKVFRSLFSLLVSESPLLFSFNVDVLGALDVAEAVDFPFADGFGLLAAAAFRRCRALSSLGSARVSNALHVFLTQ